MNVKQNFILNGHFLLKSFGYVPLLIITIRYETQKYRPTKTFSFHKTNISLDSYDGFCTTKITYEIETEHINSILHKQLLSDCK